jgi:hypothetical protein
MNTNPKPSHIKMPNKNNTSHPSRKPEAIYPNFPSDIISKRMWEKQLRV